MCSKYPWHNANMFLTCYLHVTNISLLRGEELFKIHQSQSITSLEKDFQNWLHILALKQQVLLLDERLYAFRNGPGLGAHFRNCPPLKLVPLSLLAFHHGFIISIVTPWNILQSAVVFSARDVGHPVSVAAMGIPGVKRHKMQYAIRGGGDISLLLPTLVSKLSHIPIMSLNCPLHVPNMSLACPFYVPNTSLTCP